MTLKEGLTQISRKFPGCMLFTGSRYITLGDLYHCLNNLHTTDFAVWLDMGAPLDTKQELPKYALDIDIHLEGDRITFEDEGANVEWLIVPKPPRRAHRARYRQTKYTPG